MLNSNVSFFSHKTKLHAFASLQERETT